MSTPTVEIKISSMYPPGQPGGIRAYAYATIAGCMGIRGIKVVEGGRDGLFVSMPSRKTVDGYKEVCFPVTAEFRNELHNAVLSAYQQAFTMAQAPAAQQEAPEGVTSQESQQEAPEGGATQEGQRETARGETSQEGRQEALGEEMPQEGQQMAGM